MESHWILYDYYWKYGKISSEISQSIKVSSNDMTKEYKPNSKYKILNAKNKCNYVTTLDWLHGYEIVTSFKFF